MLNEIIIFQTPNTITIGEYSYSFKSALKGDNYSYRCTCRSKYHVIINMYLIKSFIIANLSTQYKYVVK